MAIIVRLSTLVACLLILYSVDWCVAEEEDSGAGQESDDLELDRRNVVQLGNLIRRCTGRRALLYLDYGCYCGLGGSGTPVDATDVCCQTHDACYTATSCKVTHKVKYKVTCRRRCECTCRDPVGSCEYQACQCDVQLATCLAAAAFNPANVGFCPNSTTSTAAASTTSTSPVTSSSPATTSSQQYRHQWRHTGLSITTTSGDVSTQMTTSGDVSTQTSGPTTPAIITTGSDSTVTTTPYIDTTVKTDTTLMGGCT